MSDQQSSPASSPGEEPQGYNFGTFAGVYTPALLTILGLVMFMRINFVLGNAGLMYTIGILALGASITLATGLSIAAIATNTEVKGGGAYYLISRVLGPCFGTSIGLTLFAAQALAIPFNILGASEALVSNWEQLRPFFPLLNLAIGAGICFLVWKGADWAIKAQYVIMSILACSVVVFMLGPIGNFSFANLRANLWELPGTSMVTQFALFFPAVTGIMAGVNMSGDLKNPHRSIPRGTLLALGTAVILYLIQIFLAAGCFDREEMIRTPYRILTHNALWGMWFMVLAGVQAATLSTALGWFLGAPRVLQSLGFDDVLPGIGFFKKGVGKFNEPKRAIFVVMGIITPILLWAGFLGRQEVDDIGSSPINLMSELVSLFFLFTYAIINIAAFVESHGANPSFRPRFRCFHWSIALYGATACCIAAFRIQFWLSLTALVIILGLYIWCRVRNLEMSYGDARRGFVYSRLRTNLLQLMRLPLHPKNWRPTIAILSPEPEKRGDLVEYAQLFSQRRGILSIIQIIEEPEIESFGAIRSQRLEELRGLIQERGWEIFPTVVVAPEFDMALEIVLQSHSLDPIRPNIIMMRWPHRNERIQPFFRHLSMIVRDFKRNALVLANASSTFVPRSMSGGTIDIWWESQAGGSLMTILAYLIQLDRGWRRSVLRIFLMDSRAEEKRLRSMLDRARIEVEIVRIDPGATINAMLPKFSFNAEMIFIEFNGFEERNGGAFNHSMIYHELSTLPPCFLVVSNGEADLLA